MQSLLGNSRKHDIVFFYSGRIDISARIAHLLNINQGEVLDIMHHNGEFFLYVKHRNPVFGKHQAVVKFSNKYGKHCRVYSKKIARSFFYNSADKTAYVRFSVGEPVLQDNKIFLPIIKKLEL